MPRGVVTVNKQQTITLIVGASSALAIGFFVIKVKKTYDELKELEKENEHLQLEEVKQEALQQLEDYHVKMQGPDREEYYIEGSEELEEYLDDEEEVEKLRHDPNSVEAMVQYQNMRMADIGSGTHREIFQKMFGIPFEPDSDKDYTIFENISQERIDFFGPDSVYSDQASMAEVYLHFANLADFDMDRGVEYWVTMFFSNTGLEFDMHDYEIEDIMDEVSQHTYVVPTSDPEIYSFGIFGLLGDEETCENYFSKLSFQDQYWKLMNREVGLE